MKTGALTTGVVVGGALLGVALPTFGEEDHRPITRGDAAILRFLAAAEIIETDLWLQYNELGGIQDSELPDGSGNAAYTAGLLVLDGDMPQYIHDNTEDELTHEVFINNYLVSKGADPVDLEKFRILNGSSAPGSSGKKRLTNLMQLTVDTSWWTRYRSRTGNPDLGDTFPQAVDSLATGQHPAIPRTAAEAQFQSDGVTPTPFTQAIANTAGFHFAFIEQGGTSLYPSLAQRVSSVEVLRILLSIGGVEIAHFQTWHDKAGNAPSLGPIPDPANPSTTVFFPDLNATIQVAGPSKGGEDFQTNLIMPEPTFFLNKNLGPVSIIRPTQTRKAAMGALNSFVKDGLFIGQSQDFLTFLTRLA